MTASTDDPLENVLDRAIKETDGDKVSFGDLLDMFGHRSFGPVVALLGLIAVIPPVGGIPGLPAAIGLIILLFSAQIVFGASHIWVPDFIENLSIEKEKLRKAEDRWSKWLKRIDRLISERMDFLTGGWAVYIAAILISVLAILMIPLELVPFAAAAPGVAIMVFGLAFVARDGVLMLIGYATSAIAIGLAITRVPWGTVAGWF